MANRTVKYATSIHGTNPQYLIEKIIRERIYDSKYWQEKCFLLTSALVLERAVDDLRYVGGTYGAKPDPTQFLSLVLKLLQIQPQKEIIYLFIEQPDFKYLRALGAFYLRLTGKPVEIYKKLEPLYNDYRKLRMRDSQGKFSVLHMDEFIDDLLREDEEEEKRKVLNITLPRLTPRAILEANRDIEPYKSELEEQNLIPTQLIEEKIERQKDESDRREKSSSSRSRHARELSSRHHNHHHNHHRNSSSHKRRDDHHDDDQSRDRHSYHHREQRDRDGHRHDYKDHSRDRHRSRSRSPRQERKLSSKYTSGKGRFSKEEIDNENAIRAKVGLKPLR